MSHVGEFKRLRYIFAWLLCCVFCYGSLLFLVFWACFGCLLVYVHVMDVVVVVCLFVCFFLSLFVSLVCLID